MATEEQQDMLGESSFSEDLADHLDQVPVNIRRKWPKDLAALVDIYEAELKRMGRSKEEAHQISLRLLLAQANYGGGRYFYLPKGDKLKQAVRDHQIWQEFSGRNINELSQKYNLTVQRIYDIIREQRALDQKRRQPELF